MTKDDNILHLNIFGTSWYDFAVCLFGNSDEVVDRYSAFAIYRQEKKKPNWSVYRERSLYVFILHNASALLITSFTLCALGDSRFIKPTSASRAVLASQTGMGVTACRLKAINERLAVFVWPFEPTQHESDFSGANHLEPRN